MEKNQHPSDVAENISEDAVVATVEADETAAAAATVEADEPLDRNVRLVSPGRMVARRFFRSKLSVAGLVMLIALVLFCWLGPVVYTQWGERETDMTGKLDLSKTEVVYVLDKATGDYYTDDDWNKLVKAGTRTEADGEYFRSWQITEEQQTINSYAPMSRDHLLGTDEKGNDVFVRLMYGGRVSLTVSFMTVFVIGILGVVLGGISGYFGGVVDNIIMRVCDVLMCIPSLPILLIFATVLTSIPTATLPSDYRIYIMMLFLTLFSWAGTARLVRGQILSLREQEYMVAAEAMGYSTGRKIFKHLVPNVLPQLIVSMTMSLGGMILYEASLSYLGVGGMNPEQAAWGSMIDAVSKMEDFAAHINVWGPPGLCIVLVVLAFNFVGDGLRDAFDPKMRR